MVHGAPVVFGLLISNGSNERTIVPTAQKSTNTFVKVHTIVTLADCRTRLVDSTRWELKLKIKMQNEGHIPLRKTHASTLQPLHHPPRHRLRRDRPNARRGTAADLRMHIARARRALQSHVLIPQRRPLC